MRHAVIVTVLAVAAVSQSSTKSEAQLKPIPVLVPPQTQTVADGHVAWVVETMKRMQTIKSGMTRKELLAVFTEEGGLSTPLRRTFVSRDCPYFKVDVTFQAAGRPDRGQDGRTTLIEDERDIISSISTPYLAWMIID